MLLSEDEAARLAVTALQSISPAQHDAHACVSALLSDGEPFADVHKLFEYYNILYFRQLLIPRVEVLWSPRLTLCAGICELSKNPATGKLDRIRIKLSTPLLQYRPRSDTVNTLLHEAIHAYFFVTTSFRHARSDDGTGHGPAFQLLADTINAHGNYNITVFHEFHDEVDSFRTHVWQCDGPCKTQPPFFGLVKRTMNRPPGKSDTWWEKHEAECGGTYTKIQEPAPTKKQLDAMSKKERAGRQRNKLDTWLKVGKKEPEGEADSSDQSAQVGGEGKTSPKAQSVNRKTDEKLPNHSVRAAATPMESFLIAGAGQKRPRASLGEEDDITFVEKKVIVECPICNLRVAELDINEHLDKIHPP